MMEVVLRALDRVNAERGQGLAEYSLILAFVLMVCFVAVGLLGVMIGVSINDFLTKWAEAAVP